MDGFLIGTVIFILVSFILLAFFWFRNDYTYSRIHDAIEAVYNYNILTPYYLSQNVAVMEYNKYFLSLTRWGKYSGIKDEYIELVKPYFD